MGDCQSGVVTATNEPALASPDESVIARYTVYKNKGLEELSWILTAGWRRREMEETRVIFPKDIPFQEAPQGQKGAKGSSTPCLPFLCSSAPTWPNPRNQVAPKLAKCLADTKINLPSLSYPPLASIFSVLALISSPRDE